VVDHDDVVGQPLGLVEVLGGEQRGGAVGDELVDDVPHLEAAARVEPGGRLVEEQHDGTAMRLMAMSSRRRMPPE
jgi:hypothetical protein